MTALAWEDTSSWFLPAPTFPVALLWVTGKTQQALEGQDHTADDRVLELHTLHLPHKFFPAVKKTTAKTSSFKNSRQVQPTRRWTEPQRYLLRFFSRWSVEQRTKNLRARPSAECPALWCPGPVQNCQVLYHVHHRCVAPTYTHCSPPVAPNFHGFFQLRNAENIIWESNVLHYLNIFSKPVQRN